MNWAGMRDLKWPDDIPAEYCTQKPGSPVLGALSPILITLCRHIESLERRVAELERVPPRSRYCEREWREEDDNPTD
jgi:hypothetical protein